MANQSFHWRILPVSILGSMELIAMALGQLSQGRKCVDQVWLRRIGNLMLFQWHLHLAGVAKKHETVPGEMGQLAKCLLSKHGDLSLTPSLHRNICACCCELVLGGRSWGIPGTFRPGNLVKSVSPKLQQENVPKIKMDSVWGREFEADLWFPRTYICTHIFIYMPPHLNPYTTAHTHKANKQISKIMKRKTELKLESVYYRPRVHNLDKNMYFRFDTWS